MSYLSISRYAVAGALCALAIASPAQARPPGGEAGAAAPVVAPAPALRLPPAFRTPRPSATMAEFLTQTLANVHGYWARVSPLARGTRTRVRYRWPGRQPVRGCGGEPTDEYTAYYCRLDDTIYVSQIFARMLWEGLEGANGVVTSGDFAVASAIAHEYAHNLQSELGVFERSYGRTVMPTELMADCMAGMWSRWADGQGLLEAGDADEAVATFMALGDHAVNDPGHHGTPEQRRNAWLRGFTRGERANCAALLRTR